MTDAIYKFIRLCNDGFLQGWHERNGGNLSYRMTKEDVKEAESLFTDNRTFALPKPIWEVAGSYFIVAGTGRYMRNVILSPEETSASSASAKMEANSRFSGGSKIQSPHPSFPPIC